MEIHQRLKTVRKKLNLTQTEFGENIGLKQNTVGQIEKGQRSITDRTIMILCKAYHVNETWLREGTGEMFAPTPDTMIDEVAREYGLDDISRSILSAYTLMSEPKRITFNTLLQELLVDLTQDSPPFTKLSQESPAPTEEKPVGYVWEDFDVEEEMERYRQQLLEEKRAREKSSVSDKQSLA